MNKTKINQEKNIVKNIDIFKIFIGVLKYFQANFINLEVIFICYQKCACAEA